MTKKRKEKKQTYKVCITEENEAHGWMNKEESGKSQNTVISTENRISYFRYPNLK